MIRTSRAIGGIILIIMVTTPIRALSYPWPFNHATSEQQVVRQTLGSYRADDNRLHNGVDIQPVTGSSDSVYCVQTGTVIYASTEQGIRVGDPGIVYFHVVPDSSVQPESLIVVGQYLGILQPLSGSTDHVHLIDGPSGTGTVKNNPLLFLDSFVDTIPPVVDSLTFRRQGSGVMLADTLTGKVDIAVAGRDSLSPEGTDEELMPYKLGFRVYDHDTDSLVLDKFSDPTIRFTQVASHSGLGRTIHRSEDASNPEYWITNTTIDGAQPANRFWNTRARAGEAWDADSSATRNEEARWPDDPSQSPSL